MTKVVVSGLINIETTLRVDEGFPITYSPVRYPFFGVASTVCGVGYNITRALATLGDTPSFISLIGIDPLGDLVMARCEADGLPTEHLIRSMPATCQSAILYDPAGRRMIFTDLKDIQERSYPAERFDDAAAGAELAVLCNIAFSRPLLARAKMKGLRIATDVHTISDLDDAYNQDFMAAADILFMSHEKLPESPETWARRLYDRYGTTIIAIGLGGEGTLIALPGAGVIERLPAVVTRPIVNTIGAGDALFAAFIHFYLKAGEPLEAMRKAITFASWKIGERGAAEGFLDEASLEVLHLKQRRFT